MLLFHTTEICITFCIENMCLLLFRFACILAFDVPVSKEVQLIADREGVRIFQADIIYHLEDSFLGYR